MKTENAVEVKNITKSFKVYFDKGHTLKEKTLFRGRRKYEERKVLNGVSFEVKKGEALGLIGRNGCGKSTILKLLTKIMYPDSGTMEMRGRVSSLIELGAGFHPDMSGRENIYINASIFGLSKKEIDERVDDIIEFSEIEEFIDNPVRTYSSGMYMRLAFSVAINVDADILLIDEILAVGDTAFQMKCFNKLREVKRKGSTIIIVSHSMGQIEQICEKTIWIENGNVQEMDSSGKVIKDYLEYMDADCSKTMKEINADSAVRVSKGANIKNVLLSQYGKTIEEIKCGEDVDVEIEYIVENREITDFIVEFKIIRYDGIVCYGTDSRGEMRQDKIKENGCIICKIKKLNLAAGKYWIDASLKNCDMAVLDSVEKCCVFNIHSLEDEMGVIRLEHQWIFSQ